MGLIVLMPLRVQLQPLILADGVDAEFPGTELYGQVANTVPTGGSLESTIRTRVADLRRVGVLSMQVSA